MEKIGLKGVVKFCSVDTNDILDIHKYFMKKTLYNKNAWVN